jgi:hypothetical protein
MQSKFRISLVLNVFSRYIRTEYFSKTEVRINLAHEPEFKGLRQSKLILNNLGFLLIYNKIVFRNRIQNFS